MRYRWQTPCELRRNVIKVDFKMSSKRWLNMHVNDWWLLIGSGSSIHCVTAVWLLRGSTLSSSFSTLVMWKLQRHSSPASSPSDISEYVTCFHSLSIMVIMIWEWLVGKYISMGTCSPVVSGYYGMICDAVFDILQSVCFMITYWL